MFVIEADCGQGGAKMVQGWHIWVGTVGGRHASGIGRSDCLEGCWRGGEGGGEAAYWRDRETCMAYRVWRIMENEEGIARAERLISSSSLTCRLHN